MKQSEIKVGHEYSNDTLAIKYLEHRRILHIYTDHYDGKKYVDYKITKSHWERGMRKCLQFTILLKSFARWAKKDVS